MRGHTHLAAGLLIALLFAKVFSDLNIIIIIILGLLGAALPDVDHGRSLLGRHVKIGGKLFRHRGIIHSLLVLVIFSAVVFLIFQNAIYMVVFAIAYFSHLVLDMLDGRIALFLPAEIKYGKRHKFSGIIDFSLFVVFILLDSWLIL
ncbi:MAG: metal-dependent hydrolase [archaeon]